jgi:hypothetical protein
MEISDREMCGLRKYTKTFIGTPFDLSVLEVWFVKCLSR